MEPKVKTRVRRALRIGFICNVVINGLLNALSAWLLNKNKPNMDMSFWVATINWIITCHIICFIVLTITASLAKTYRNRGLYTESNKLVALPTSPLLLKLLFSEITWLCAAVLFVLPLTLLGINSLPVGIFVLYKGIGGAIVGSTVANIVMRRLLIKKQN